MSGLAFSGAQTVSPGKAYRSLDNAGVAQSVEQLICNQSVAGSIPVASSNQPILPYAPAEAALLAPTLWVSYQKKDAAQADSVAQPFLGEG